MRTANFPGWNGFLVLLALLAGPAVGVAANPSFAGTWELVPEKSTNLGLMAATKVTLVIAQTANALAIKETSTFQGKSTDRVVGYDLSGKPVTNQAPMGGADETTARWDDGRLVVTWTGAGTLAGTKVVRTETRSLSADGRSMSVEMVYGEGPAVIMVFARRK
jgi:hypothetical protein